MELYPLLRVLWRRRVLVGLGLLISIVVAAEAGSGPADTRAVAHVRVLLDTLRSQLIDAHPALVETMPGRVAVLDKLLGTEPARQRLADRIGIPVGDLAVVDSQLLLPPVPASLPRAAAEAAAAVPEPYVLTVRANADVALISIKARAPKPSAAAALARAAVDDLRATVAPAGLHARRAYGVDRVAPVRARAVQSGGDSKMAAAVALVLFGLWCVVLAFVPARGRSRRSIGPGSAPRPAG